MYSCYFSIIKVTMCVCVRNSSSGKYLFCCPCLNAVILWKPAPFGSALLLSVHIPQLSGIFLFSFVCLYLRDVLQLLVAMLKLKQLECCVFGKVRFRGRGREWQLEPHKEWIAFGLKSGGGHGWLRKFGGSRAVAVSNLDCLAFGAVHCIALVRDLINKAQIWALYMYWRCLFC